MIQQFINHKVEQIQLLNKALRSMLELLKSPHHMGYASDIARELEQRVEFERLILNIQTVCYHPNFDELKQVVYDMAYSDAFRYPPQTILQAAQGIYSDIRDELLLPAEEQVRTNALKAKLLPLQGKEVKEKPNDDENHHI